MIKIQNPSGQEQKQEQHQQQKKRKKSAMEKQASIQLFSKWDSKYGWVQDKRFGQFWIE